MRIELEDGWIDLGLQRLERDGRSIDLTTRERTVLAYLAERPGQDVDREELLSEALGIPGDILTRALDVIVARLRAKLERDPKRPELIVTVHGVGYRFVPQTGQAASDEATWHTLGRATTQLCGHRVSVELERAAVLIDGRHELDLTAAERAILEVLAAHRGAPISSRDLAHAALGRAKPVGALTNAVHRLRRKLGEPSFVVHQRGQGYRLNADVRRTVDEGALGILRRVAECVGVVLGYDDCVVYVRDGDCLVQKAAFGDKCSPSGDVARPLVLPIGGSIVGDCAARGVPELVFDTRTDRRYVRDVRDGRAELCVPVIHQNCVVGVVDSESTRTGAYTPPDIDRLAAIAAVAKLSFAELCG